MCNLDTSSVVTRSTSGEDFSIQRDVSELQQRVLKILVNKKHVELSFTTSTTSTRTASDSAESSASDTTFTNIEQDSLDLYKK